MTLLSLKLTEAIYFRMLSPTWTPRQRKETKKKNKRRSGGGLRSGRRSTSSTIPRSQNSGSTQSVWKCLNILYWPSLYVPRSADNIQLYISTKSITSVLDSTCLTDILETQQQIIVSESITKTTPPSQLEPQSPLWQEPFLWISNHQNPSTPPSPPPASSMAQHPEPSRTLLANTWSHHKPPDFTTDFLTPPQTSWVYIYVYVCVCRSHTWSTWCCIITSSWWRWSDGHLSRSGSSSLTSSLWAWRKYDR